MKDTTISMFSGRKKQNKIKKVIKPPLLIILKDKEMQRKINKTEISLVQQMGHDYTNYHNHSLLHPFS